VVRNHQAAAFGEPNMEHQTESDVESEEDVIAEPIPPPTKKQKTVIFEILKCLYFTADLYFRLQLKQFLLLCLELVA
jgi:hypothetical protein